MDRLLDPIRAYDRLAAEFAAVSDRRRSYLNEVERQIVLHVPAGSSSLLDIGAGDGMRAARIAKAARITNVVLLEPSSEMRKLWPSHTEGWPLSAERLGEKTGRFDVITCLWNVLGHIFPAQSRVDVLRHCARLLSPGGRFFIDVNHRYNMSAYGAVPTLCRMLRDLTLPSERNGDVTLHWRIAGDTCSTRGHVFTHSEFRRLATKAGLVIEKSITVDYSSGQLRKSRFAGNPLFILRRR